MTRIPRALGAAILIFCGSSAVAQYAPVDPVPLGNAVTSVMANKISGDIASEENRSNSVSSRCFADSGPGPERRAMETEYAQRLSAGGKAQADEWRAEHGRQYRAKLIAEGKCPRP